MTKGMHNQEEGEGNSGMGMRPFTETQTRKEIRDDRLTKIYSELQMTEAEMQFRFVIYRWTKITVAGLIRLFFPIKVMRHSLHECKGALKFAKWQIFISQSWRESLLQQSLTLEYECATQDSDSDMMDDEIPEYKEMINVKKEGKVFSWTAASELGSLG